MQLVPASAWYGASERWRQGHRRQRSLSGGCLSKGTDAAKASAAAGVRSPSCSGCVLAQADIGSQLAAVGVENSFSRRCRRRRAGRETGCSASTAAMSFGGDLEARRRTGDTTQVVAWTHPSDSTAKDGGFGRRASQCSARPSGRACTVPRHGRLAGNSGRGRVCDRRWKALFQASVWDRSTCHRSVPPAHGDARGLSGQCAVVVSGLRAGTGAASKSVFGSTVGAGSGRLLEVPATSFTRCRQRGSASRAPDSAGCASAWRLSVANDNGRRARAAVMRYGCRRGECFEGYEPRCGERRASLDRLERGLRATKRAERGCRSGNAANPVRIGMQHARAPVWSKPSRR
jgi:hypothetical protein